MTVLEVGAFTGATGSGNAVACDLASLRSAGGEALFDGFAAD